MGFFNDDPRQAVILGSMFSTKNPLPKGMADPSQENIEKAIVTKKGTTIGFTDDDKAAVFIETADSNKVLLDDDRQLVHISDQHGNVIMMDKDGITIESAKDIMIKGRGNIDIQGQKVDVK